MTDPSPPTPAADDWMFPLPGHAAKAAVVPKCLACEAECEPRCALRYSVLSTPQKVFIRDKKKKKKKKGHLPRPPASNVTRCTRANRSRPRCKRGVRHGTGGARCRSRRHRVTVYVRERKEASTSCLETGTSVVGARALNFRHTF